MHLLQMPLAILLLSLSSSENCLVQEHSLEKRLEAKPVVIQKAICRLHC